MDPTPASPSVLVIEIRGLIVEPAAEMIERRRRLEAGRLVSRRRRRHRVAEDVDSFVPVGGFAITVARRDDHDLVSGRSQASR